MRRDFKQTNKKAHVLEHSPNLASKTLSPSVVFYHRCQFELGRRRMPYVGCMRRFSDYDTKLSRTNSRHDVIVTLSCHLPRMPRLVGFYNDITPPPRFIEKTTNRPQRYGIFFKSALRAPPMPKGLPCVHQLPMACREDTRKGRTLMKRKSPRRRGKRQKRKYNFYQQL